MTDAEHDHQMLVRIQSQNQRILADLAAIKAAVGVQDAEVVEFPKDAA